MFPFGDVEPSNLLRHNLLKLCYIMRREQCAPLELSTIWLCHIDKHSNQPGCKRFRRLEICDPVGAFWAHAIWKSRNRQFSETQYGYTIGRQGLHAVLGVRLQMWRLHSLHEHAAG